MNIIEVSCHLKACIHKLYLHAVQGSLMRLPKPSFSAPPEKLQSQQRSPLTGLVPMEQLGIRVQYVCVLMTLEGACGISSSGGSSMMI